MAKNYNQEFEGEWVYPKMRGYLLGCCDCGLVHTMDFEICAIGNLAKTDKDGLPLVRITPIHSKQLLVRLRAKRNRKETNEQRTARGIKFTKRGKKGRK